VLAIIVIYLFLSQISTKNLSTTFAPQDLKLCSTGT